MYVTRENQWRIGSSITMECSGSAGLHNVHQTQNDIGHVYNADWSTHELYMVTCTDMWDDWPSGAQVIVGYVDTAALVMDKLKEKMPTALVLTSGLTDHTELKPVLQVLVDQGYRLIIPSLIGMSYPEY